jgi:hypothetical protein
MGAPTDAGILQLEIESVSSVRKRIGMMRFPCETPGHRILRETNVEDSFLCGQIL